MRRPQHFHDCFDCPHFIDVCNCVRQKDWDHHNRFVRWWYRLVLRMRAP